VKARVERQQPSVESASPLPSRSAVSSDSRVSNEPDVATQADASAAEARPERRESTADRRRSSADRRGTAIERRAAAAAHIPDTLSRRVVVDSIRPEIDGGRFPIKRTVGETVQVEATIFADGHDVIAAVVRDRRRQSGVGSWDSGLGIRSP